MADTITLPELPALQRASGDELIAVWKEDRLVKLPQASLRGSQTFSGPSDPPLDVAAVMALAPVLNDRWRNTTTGAEWKVASLEPFTWTFDGNVKGESGVGQPGPPGVGQTGPKGDSGRAETRAAAVAIQHWTAVVYAPDGRFQPADTSNPLHRQQVIGVVAAGAPLGAAVTAVTAGPVKGPDGGFAPGLTLFVGVNGRLVTEPPLTGWRQIVAAASAVDQVNIALGEASVVEASADVLLSEGGFSTPCGLDQAADPSATNRYVTPAANARALAGKASLSHTPVADADYQCLSTDVQVGMVALTAPRTIWLPDIDTYPFQELVIADESGACSPILPITILPGPGTGDILDGAPILLEDTRRGLRFRRGAANLWIRM